MELTVTIASERFEAEVVVRARVNTHHLAASWYSPAEGGEVEILSTEVDGVPVDLTDSETDEAIEAVSREYTDTRWDGPDAEDY